MNKVKSMVDKKKPSLGSRVLSGYLSRGVPKDVRRLQIVFAVLVVIISQFFL